MKTIVKSILLLLFMVLIISSCKVHKNVIIAEQASGEKLQQSTVDLIFSPTNYYIKDAIKYNRIIAIDSILVYRSKIVCHEYRWVAIRDFEDICPGIEMHDRTPETDQLFSQTYVTDSLKIIIPDSLKHIFKYYEGLSDLKDPNTQCCFFSPILNPENKAMNMIQLFFYTPAPPGIMGKGQNFKSYGLRYIFYDVFKKVPKYKKIVGCSLSFEDFDDLDAERYWEK